MNKYQFSKSNKHFLVFYWETQALVQFTWTLQTRAFISQYKTAKCLVFEQTKVNTFPPSYFDSLFTGS